MQVWETVGKPSEAPVRKPRRDAQRNRERILEVEKEAFTRSGANAILDDIARPAGVGPGTLCRHFPARDELLEVFYRTELSKLAGADPLAAHVMELRFFGGLQEDEAALVLGVSLIIVKRD